MRKRGKSSWLRASAATLLLCALFFSIEGCAGRYNPTLFPSYDVLNPGPEVRMNPLGFDKDDNTIVNQAFILWVYELKKEIKKLREELRKTGI